MNVIILIFVIISTVTALLVIPEIYAQDSQKSNVPGFVNVYQTDSSYLAYISGITSNAVTCCFCGFLVITLS